MAGTYDTLLKSAEAKSDFGVDVGFIETIVDIASKNNLPIEINRPGIIAGMYYPDGYTKTTNIYPRIQVVDHIVLLVKSMNNKKLLDCTNLNPILVAGLILEGIPKLYS